MTQNACVYRTQTDDREKQPPLPRNLAPPDTHATRLHGTPHIREPRATPRQTETADAVTVCVSKLCGVCAEVSCVSPECPERDPTPRTPGGGARLFHVAFYSIFARDRGPVARALVRHVCRGVVFTHDTMIYI